MWIEFVSDTTTGLNLKWEVTETCHCIESGFNLFNTLKNIVFSSSVTNEYTFYQVAKKLKRYVTVHIIIIIIIIIIINMCFTFAQI